MAALCTIIKRQVNTSINERNDDIIEYERFHIKTKYDGSDEYFLLMINGQLLFRIDNHAKCCTHHVVMIQAENNTTKAPK